MDRAEVRNKHLRNKVHFTPKAKCPHVFDLVSGSVVLSFFSRTVHTDHADAGGGGGLFRITLQTG